MTFNPFEKVLWWNGYSMIESVIDKSSKYSCLIVSDEAKKAYEALICDLYHKTPQDLARLKSRINDLRYLRFVILCSVV